MRSRAPALALRASTRAAPVAERGSRKGGRKARMACLCLYIPQGMCLCGERERGQFLTREKFRDDGEDTNRLCLCGRPWQDARWAGHPRLAWGRTAGACAADSHRYGRHLTEQGIRWGWGTETVSNSCPVTHSCRTRTDAFLLRALRATIDTSARGR